MDIFARYEISKSVVLRCSQEPNEAYTVFTDPQRIFLEPSSSQLITVVQ